LANQLKNPVVAGKKAADIQTANPNSLFRRRPDSEMFRVCPLLRGVGIDPSSQKYRDFEEVVPTTSVLEQLQLRENLSAPASNTKRIAKNTLMLYFRQILIMTASLYTVRVVLNTLGAEDYGIYNVAAGIVTMFAFLSNSMASASQRYFAFEIGRGDFERLKRVFSVSLAIYVMIAALVLLLAETAGLAFVRYKLAIPVERKAATLWVYHASIMSFLCTIITTPFMAAIIAHEDMNIYAYVSIVEAVLKLAMVFILEFLAWDKLKAYAILMCAAAFINTAVYRTVCMLKYRECKVTFYRNKNLFYKNLLEKKLFIEIFAYNGWNLFGNVTGMLRNQGTTVLLNQFFNPLVIAAQSIAAQVNAAVSSFSSNFLNALHPQIIKSYSTGQKELMRSLVFRGAKASYFLMYLFALPFFLEAPLVLSLWLKEPPEYAVVFTRLILINVLVNSISYPIVTMAMATGRIKAYMLILGLIQAASFISAWLVLCLGFPPWSVFILSIGTDIVMLVVRLFLTKKLVRFSMKEFFKRSAFPICAVTVLASALPVMIMLFFKEGIPRLCAVGIASAVSLGLSVFLAGLDGEEKRLVKAMVLSKVRNR
jgi:O-antigen/teichoic acid export membrane protein